MKTVFHGNIAELFPVNLAQTPKQKMCQFPIHFVEKKEYILEMVVRVTIS